MNANSSRYSLSRTKLRPDFRLNKLALAVVVATLATRPGMARAADCNWLPASGNWNNAANWSCGLVPSGPALDTATIGVGNTVTVDSAQSIFHLHNSGSTHIDSFLLTLQSGGSSVNANTIDIGSATTAALQMFHNVDNSGGVINIGDGSALNQFAGAISGGTINGSGAGKLVVFSNSSNFLDGVTVNGTLDLASVANSGERIINGLTLTGEVNIGNGGILSLDSAGTPGGNQTIDGAGHINLNDAGARLAIEGTGSTTLGANIVVHGQGNIGLPLLVGGNNTLTNNGLISADVSGGTLEITNPAGGGGSSLVNNGTLQAINGASLLVTTALTNTAQGHMTVTTDSLINLQTSAFANQGLLEGLGTVQTLNAATAVINAGTLAPGIGNIGTLTINGSYNQTADGSLDIDLNSLASLDLLKVNGAANLSGMLNVFCAGACSMTVGEEVTVLDAFSNSLSGSFSGLTLFGFGAGAFDVVYDLPNGDVKLRVTEAVSAVPIPGTIWLMLSCFGGLGAMARRRKV